MASNSKFSQLMEQFQDKLQEQVWYQQIRAKWDELDPRHRQIASMVGIFGSFAVLIIVTLSMYSSVSTKQAELDEKLALIKHLNRSQDELRRLRDNNPLSGMGGSDEPWTGYIESQASQMGIAAENLKVNEQAPQSGSNGAPSEQIIDIDLKKVNVRQLVKLIFQLENGARPAKVKTLQVDTEPDESGYVNLKFSLLTYQAPKK